MRYLGIMLATLASLVACKNRPNHYDVKLQDGTPGYRLDCDKREFSKQDCLNEAARICHGSAIIMDDANNGINTIVECGE